MQNIIKTEQNLPVGLIDVAKSYIEQSTSSATRRAYTSDFKIFCKWCLLHKVTAVPASPEVVVVAGFSVEASACQYPNEYLLLLQRDDAQWTPELLRERLKLTFREAEILMWIARGKTNKEIGIILTTSPRTVNKHLEHIFEKLGVSTRAAAVAMVLKRG